MRRRDLLALSGLGALGSLAGCLGPTGTETLPTPLPGADGYGAAVLGLGERSEAGGTTLTVWDATVTDAAYYTTADGLRDVYSPPGARLVFVRLTAQGARPPLSAFELRVGEEAYRPVERVAGRPLDAVPRRYDPYSQSAVPDPDGRWVLFEVPGGREADTATLAWTGPETAVLWGVPRRQVGRLAGPVPELAMEGFELPSTATVDADPVARVTVSNRATSPGTFYGVLNYSGAVSAAEDISASVPGGESVTVEEPVAWTGEPLTVKLAWSGEHVIRTVEPVSS